MYDKARLDEECAAFYFGFHFRKGYDRATEANTGKDLAALVEVRAEALKTLEREMRGTYMSVVAYWHGIACGVRALMAARRP